MFGVYGCFFGFIGSGEYGSTQSITVGGAGSPGGTGGSGQAGQVFVVEMHS